jgi:hypothetical protein
MVAGGRLRFPFLDSLYIDVKPACNRDLFWMNS